MAVAKERKPLRAAAILIFAGTALCCLLYLGFARHRYQNILASEAIMLAQSIETMLHPEHVQTLTGTEKDLLNPEYDIVKRSLARLVETSNPIRFAYLVGLRDGKVVILLDSESPDSPDYSPPGQVYSEADESFLIPFTTGKTILTRPVTDRWGRWISALVPLRNPAGSGVFVVLGIDYAVTEWNARLLERMIPDFVIATCFLVIVFAFSRMLAQHGSLRRLADRLAVKEALYRSVFEQAPVGIAVVNDKNFVVRSDSGESNINPMFERILGRDGEELRNLQWTEITHPDDLASDLEKYARFRDGIVKTYTMEKRFVKPDGSVVWTQMTISPLLDSPYSESMHLCLLEDISARKKMEASLVESERSKAVLLSNLPGMAYRCDWDRDWTMRYVSAGCEALTGWPPESLIGNRDISFNEVISPEYRELLWEKWRGTLPLRKPFQQEYEITTAGGDRKWVLELGQGVWNEKDELLALEGIILDISDRKRIEDELKYASEHEPRTGLRNRKSLEESIEREHGSAGVGNEALVGVNLGAIHILNLRYGFKYSQELTKKLAGVLTGLCDENIQLYHTYQYRFAFYLTGYRDRVELNLFCAKVALTLEKLLAEERIPVGIGVVEIGKDEVLDIDQLLKTLLIASEREMNALSKDLFISFYDEETRLAVLREEKIGEELVRIAAGDEDRKFNLQFQPILDIGTGRMSGFEALARMNSDAFGEIPPSEFIPIAEKTKLIIPLGKRIILEAVDFLRLLDEGGFADLKVFINISAVQLLREDFSESLRRLLLDLDVDPKRVALEITESVLDTTYQHVNEILRSLKSEGFGIALDDFGRDYSSLARERSLDIDYLKIDQFFIDALREEDPAKAISSDIISIGHKLGHRVIAEGVETEAQLEYLRAHGCDMAQGFFIGRPMGAPEAIGILRPGGDIE